MRQLFFLRKGNPSLENRLTTPDWRWWSRLLVVVTNLLYTAPTLAHTRSQSFSSWYIHDGQVRLNFVVQALEATRLGQVENERLPLDELLAQHLASHITVHARKEACRTVAGPRTRTTREGYLQVEWRFTCSTEGALAITNDAFFAVAPSHVHYARVRTGAGPPVEYLFTNAERTREVLVSKRTTHPSGGTSFGSYVWLGVEHMLIGIDHLAFLLALLLLCRRVREVIFMVTGFTLGHSITLSLAVLGLVTPHVPVIEALIGFTIALIAAENVGVTTGATQKVAITASAVLIAFALLKAFAHLGLPVMTLLGLTLFTACSLPLASTQQHAMRMRPLLTVLFGLIHGFGFASVLMEMNLPAERLAQALFGFNIGVEIGQLGIVALLWSAGTFLTRRFPDADYRFAVDVASAALCALGLYWFVGRAFVA